MCSRSFKNMIEIPNRLIQIRGGKMKKGFTMSLRMDSDVVLHNGAMIPILRVDADEAPEDSFTWIGLLEFNIYQLHETRMSYSEICECDEEDEVPELDEHFNVTDKMIEQRLFDLITERVFFKSIQLIVIHLKKEETLSSGFFVSLVDVHFKKSTLVHRTDFRPADHDLDSHFNEHAHYYFTPV